MSTPGDELSGDLPGDWACGICGEAVTGGANEAIQHGFVCKGSGQAELRHVHIGHDGACTDECMFMVFDENGDPIDRRTGEPWGEP